MVTGKWWKDYTMLKDFAGKENFWLAKAAARNKKRTGGQMGGRGVL